MRTTKRIFSSVLAMIIISVMVLGFSGCGKKVSFEYWNECSSLTALKDYVKNVTNKNSPDYIPVEDRIAEVMKHCNHFRWYREHGMVPADAPEI